MALGGQPGRSREVFDRALSQQAYSAVRVAVELKRRPDHERGPEAWIEAFDDLRWR
jgi:hypothetical protein